MPHNPGQRVLLIGLDCAAPRFIFDSDDFALPTMTRLRNAGCWGTLRSCDPPITVPAWSVMMSSKDPGTLGQYGFRNRAAYDYGALPIATSNTVGEKRLWDILSDCGKRVVVLGVPQTYPPMPVNGCMVSGILTPGTEVEYTYPASLKDELEGALGGYIIDVANFRTENKEALLESLHALSMNRFDAAEYLLKAKEWDFFAMVDMGIDRLHHAFWKYADPSHPLYEPDSAFAGAIRGLYEAIDARIGELVSLVGEETAVMVVSDHGARALHGGICVNQWLMDEGLLSLVEAPEGPARIEDCEIDWTRTRAWSSGGYCARVYFNVEGREPGGVISASEYASFRADLAARFEAMAGPDGAPLGNRALVPENAYNCVSGYPPDLIVYFGDLAWRSVGSVGVGSVYAAENDTGPDDANHDFEGVFIMDDRGGQGGEEVRGLTLLDIAPTVLDRMGVPVPEDMQGQVIGRGEGDSSPVASVKD